MEEEEKRISFFYSTEEEEEEGRAHNCADLPRQLDAKKSLGVGLKSSLAVGRGETAKILCHETQRKFRASCQGKKKGF